MSWIQLSRRVFSIDIDDCPECGDTLRAIAPRTMGSARTQTYVEPPENSLACLNPLAILT
jgi:hypothetical protein